MSVRLSGRLVESPDLFNAEYLGLQSFLSHQTYLTVQISITFRYHISTTHTTFFAYLPAGDIGRSGLAFATDWIFLSLGLGSLRIRPISTACGSIAVNQDWLTDVNV